MESSPKRRKLDGQEEKKEDSFPRHVSAYLVSGATGVTTSRWNKTSNKQETVSAKADEVNGVYYHKPRLKTSLGVYSPRPILDFSYWVHRLDDGSEQNDLSWMYFDAGNEHWWVSHRTVNLYYHRPVEDAAAPPTASWQD